MATNRVTIIAELKDHLTGPARKAAQAVEDMGAAVTRTGKQWQDFGEQAGKAADTAGRKAQESGRRAEAGLGKAGKAADDAAKRTGASAGRMEQAFSRIDGRAGRMATALHRASGDGATALERATGRMGRALDRVDTNGAAARFGRGMDRMASHAATAAQKIEQAMGRAGKAVGLAAGALATASLVGGGNRLMDLESADVKLDVMGYDETARQSIMGTVDQAVTGTPFALNEAATAATQYLAAGIQPGDQLASRLGTTVDLAAIYDMDLGEASTILAKVQATGTLQGDEANQLLERGMPVYAALAESMGVEQSEVKGLISEGGVSADDLFAALEPSVAGGAERLGGTFKGVFANMRTAFSRAGAEFLKPLMDPLKTLMGSVTQTLKDGAPFFAALGAALGPGLEKAAQWVPAIFEALAPLKGPLINLFEAAGNALPGLVQGFAVWAKMLSFVLIPLTEIGGFLLQELGPFLPVLVPLIFGAGAAFTTWRVLSFVTPLLSGVGTALGWLARVIVAHPLLWIPLAVYAVLRVFGELYDRIDWVREGFDWFSDTLSGVVGWFNSIGDSIDRLINEKLPALGKALDINTGPLGAVENKLSSLGAGIGERTGIHGFLGTGESWGSGQGLLKMFHGSDSDHPAHADGGYTASGAHLAKVGENGTEFITNAWATDKIRRNNPGAFEHMNATGTLPPANATPGIVPLPSIGQLVVQNPQGMDGAEFATRFAAEWDRRHREATYTYATPTARGAY